MKLEIACFNYESALVAAKSGADRIEFCSGFELGGTTPDLELLKKIKSQVSIPVHVMIRPRGGDFVCSDSEFEQMKSEIERFKPFADGFVFGILDPDNKVDIERNSKLIELAKKPCTFHRAFDQINDLGEALEDVISCGFKTILASGGRGNAIDNLEQLSSLVEKAANRIEIMPGGGVRSSNIGKLVKSKATFYHSSAIVNTFQNCDSLEVRKLNSNLHR